jgi:endoglycosylceramidase
MNYIITIAALTLGAIMAYFSFPFLRRLVSFPSRHKRCYLRDSLGRICILHGLNVGNYPKHSGPLSHFGRGSAGHPWHGREEAARMKAWGLNVLRYQMFWECVEPQPGVYDEAYLEQAVKTIEEFGSEGIEVIVVLHQDLYSQRLSGNGFPEWTERDEGKSFERQEPWSKNYLQPAVMACFKNFWENKDGLLQANIRMLGHLLNRMKTVSCVLGIDVMNEPFPGKWPLTFERKELSDYYRDLQKVWKQHEISKRPYLMFEPWMSTSAGIPTNMSFSGSGVYMPHYYDFFCEMEKPYKLFNKLVMRRSMNIKAYEGQEFKSPVIYGEFGFPYQAKGYCRAFEDFISLADKHAAGWAYWSYDKETHNDRGCLDASGAPTVFLEMLVRIYPQKIAGDNPEYSFDGKKFRFSWDPNEVSDYNTPTEVYIPEPWKVDIKCTCGHVREKGILSLYPGTSKKRQSLEVEVRQRCGFPR